MIKPARFFINRTSNSGGPSVFGYRLKQELIKKGWIWDRYLPNVSYIFSCGFFRSWCRNILRLDGLYFDSENTVGNSDVLNKPIRKAYGKADGIIFQSEFCKELYSVFFGEPSCPSTVIYNGVSKLFCPNGERIKYRFDKTIICASRWRSHKRLDAIIAGFLEYGNPNTGLVIIGDGYVNKVNHPNIHYTGRVRSHELPKYLRGGDAFVYMSYLDCCPNSVIEALACGLPVLCSHNGGTHELVGINGIILKCEEDYDYRMVDLYHPPGCDKRQLADGIERILNWKNPIQEDCFPIAETARQYIDFATRC